MPIKYRHVKAEHQIEHLNGLLAKVEEQHAAAVTAKRLLGMVKPIEDDDDLSPVEDQINAYDKQIAALEQQHDNITTLLDEAKARAALQPRKKTPPKADKDAPETNGNGSNGAAPTQIGNRASRRGR